MIMEYPITRSWWETLPRQDLDREAETRAQAWKAQKDHFSMSLGLDQLRDTWEPRGFRREIMLRGAKPDV